MLNMIIICSFISLTFAKIYVLIKETALLRAVFFLFFGFVFLSSPNIGRPFI
jgi:hypothetical protein